LGEVLAQKHFSLGKAGRWVLRTYAHDPSFNPRPTLWATTHALVQKIWREWHLGVAMDMAAKVSFYFALSCFPFLLVIASLLGWIHKTSNWYSFWYWLTNYLPASAQDTVLSVMRELSKGFGGFLSFGLLLTIWSASTGFLSLMEALTDVYGGKEARSYFKRRVIAICATILSAIFLLLCFAVWSAGHLLAAFIFRYHLYIGPESRVLGWIVTLAVVWLGVDLINYFLPAKRKSWRWVSPGTALTVLYFVVASALLNVYARHNADMSRIYGALTGFIVMMLWIYLANLSVLLGAQTDAAVNELKAGRTGP
jgi:membrane protein